MSRNDGNDGYSSHSTDITSIVAMAENKISNDITTAYGLSGMDVGDLNDRVKSLSSEDVNLYGTKTFNQIPVLNYESVSQMKQDMARTGPGAFVTQGYVNTLIEDSSMFIGDDSSIVSDPNNDTPKTNEDGNLMIWRIPAGKRDSTQYVDDYGTTNEGVECTQTGNLVVYGWLADTGTVLPQEAWVAIYGMINISGQDNPKWTILQVQPWTKTAYSNKIQYIGFNIPVKKGLVLKIKTGFAVDATATATNQYNTLTFDNVQPNTFVGYIVTGG